MIKYGAKVNKEDVYRWTPLAVASEEGHKDVCEVLIKNGAEVDH